MVNQMRNETTQENAETKPTSGLLVEDQRQEQEVSVDGSVTKKMGCESPLISIQAGLMVPGNPYTLTHFRFLKCSSYLTDEKLMTFQGMNIILEATT